MGAPGMNSASSKQQQQLSDNNHHHGGSTTAGGGSSSSNNNNNNNSAKGGGGAGRFKNLFRRNSKGNVLSDGNNHLTSDVDPAVSEQHRRRGSTSATTTTSKSNHRASRRNSTNNTNNNNGKVKKGFLGSFLPKSSSSKTDESNSHENNNNNNSNSREEGPPPIPLQHESMQICNSVSNPYHTTTGSGTGAGTGSGEGIGAGGIRPIHSGQSNSHKSDTSNRRGSSRKSLLFGKNNKNDKSSSSNKSNDNNNNNNNTKTLGDQLHSFSHSGHDGGNVEGGPDSGGGPTTRTTTTTTGTGASGSSSPHRDSLFQWQDNVEKQEELYIVRQKQLIKERDGFCRRVDAYDGSIIYVEGKAAYELGNYLGGGVAGVVYEGHRLLGPEEYPLRVTTLPQEQQHEHPTTPLVIHANNNNNNNNHGLSLDQHHQGEENGTHHSRNLLIGREFCGCGPATANDAVADNNDVTMMTKQTIQNAGLGKAFVNGHNQNHHHHVNMGGTTYHDAAMKQRMEVRDASLLTMDSTYNAAASMRSTAAVGAAAHTNNVALEATTDSENNNVVIIDNIDAPSRSKHYAQAVTSQNASLVGDNDDFPSDASFMNGFMEESVAVKILNPVGFRTLAPDITNTAVVAREGVPMEKEIYAGIRPMEEKHVWWLINPSSRNLRTLQRYTVVTEERGGGGDGMTNHTTNTNAPAGVQVDRGCAEKGLRISLLAAYKDTDGKLKELPLTRCIEIWGHVPFEATDFEFKEIMTAIERVNQGLPPPPIPPSLPILSAAAAAAATKTTSATPIAAMTDNNKHTNQGGGGGMLWFGNNNNNANNEPVPGRIGTGTSSMSGSLSNSLEDLKLTTNTNNNNQANNTSPLKSQRTGIYRAAYSERQTVFCAELHAYIAIPAVPSKYIKWLRQRRAATKEVRNMTRIGRHKNVVHLFEVLELIQDTKSTMFLILELVRGGELFDLISSNAAKISNVDIVPKGFTESETVMRKFFMELVSGIHYCHSNFIAHRDLKPENLLVHYDNNQVACTLKIADFGLSATFGPNGESTSDQDTIVESLGSGPLPSRLETIDGLPSPPTSPVSPIKQQVDKILNVGGSALSFFTCGAVEDIICGPGVKDAVDDVESHPVTLKRMTSVVGSPHYVAPEIISQDSRRNGGKKKAEGGGDDPVPAICGYDGTKADVWSAGVILYAMLFRSLPFGEDLLRCPRFQSYKKWYDEIRTTGGPRCRRGNLMAPLNPVITEIDEQEYLGPHWFFPSNSSPESRDLIVYMLNPDPERRPSIQLVLRHPWLLKKGPSS